jgi:hypothetical protein
MKFSIHDSISIAGGKINEDIAYSTENYGWVIDGATGLNNRSFTGASSDAYWFVNEWNDYLKESILNNSVSIKEIITKGVEVISNKFFHLVAVEHLDRIDLPSASIVVLRVNNNKMEYFLLGDCTLVVQNNEGKSSIIKQRFLDALDNKAKEEMAGLMARKGINFIEARQEINPSLVKHRLLKNTPNGYWTLEFDKSAVENALLGYLDFEDCKKALLMSDGFSAIFDNYHIIDESNLISRVEKQGLQQIYKLLRAIEEEDAEILKFPRFKKSDDASAVIFSC